MWTAVVKIARPEIYTVIFPLFNSLEEITAFAVTSFQAVQFSDNVMLVEIAPEQEVYALCTLRSVRLNYLGRTFWSSDIPNRLSVMYNPFFSR